ncbi:low temperature requirement protein A [Arthrobacter zhaoguopingii]|uniref:low temperature requirement protein A n=1 Tax=Arthrobacter zhaoguopingii TaxID=2681491 RepID=UPI001FEF307D|nr:low temperature requirement protein A [Arthrobacter zhaoguopingii]
MTSAPMRLGLAQMRPRNPSEEHRGASPLELFFDLVFVVAVSRASAELHHAEAEQHIASGTGAYLMILFAIWWAWMNFTWFATAFDTDDWLYRVLTIVQMSGVLVIAAGASDAMTESDFWLVTIGYAIMRLAMVAQWLRAAHGDAPLRRTALKYAIGISVVQVLWLARLALPEQGGIPVFLVLVLIEIAVPIWAESSRPTPWHPHHIAERYGLFTLILLGESILASANAIIDAAESSEHISPLIAVAVSGLVIASGMWWIYFARSHHDQFDRLRNSLVFGYAHYAIFAAAGAFSAGIEVAIDYETAATALASTEAAATLTVPVSSFILGIWLLTLRSSLTRAQNVTIPALAVLIGLSALAPQSLFLTAVAIIAIVITLEIRVSDPALA